MSDEDDQPQDFDSQSSQSSSGPNTSLNKYFNKSSSPFTFFTISNTIKLPLSLKLTLNSSISPAKNYKGKYRLDFNYNQDTKFKVNFSEGENRLGMSVKYKRKGMGWRVLDGWDVGYAVDTKQEVGLEMNFWKKVERESGGRLEQGERDVDKGRQNKQSVQIVKDGIVTKQQDIDKDGRKEQIFENTLYVQNILRNRKTLQTLESIHKLFNNSNNNSNNDAIKQITHQSPHNQNIEVKDTSDNLTHIQPTQNQFTQLINVTFKDIPKTHVTFSPSLSTQIPSSEPPPNSPTQKPKPPPKQTILDIKINPKLQFKSNKFTWMLNSKLTYKLPTLLPSLTNKLTLKLKKLTPQLSLSLSSSLTHSHLSLFLDTKLSPLTPSYSLSPTPFESLSLQLQLPSLTLLFQHHKSSSLYLHYLFHPHYSISARIRKPDEKSWWEVSLNRRVSAKKVVQLSVDPKRWCLFVKQTLNGHTGFQVKVYNGYEGGWRWRNNVEIGFRFND